MPTLILETRPEPLEIDLARSAVVVVDMQNAFASSGGLLDLAGVDISGADKLVRSIGELLEAARAAGVQVIYLQTGYKPDLRRSRASIAVCQVAIGKRDALVRLLRRQFSLQPDTWIAMYEDLRNSPRCRVTFDALVAGLQEHVAGAAQ